MMVPPDLSVIILSYNTADYLQRCLADLRRAAAESSLRLEIIVVDNASTDDSPALLAKLDDVQLIANDHNAGFAAANNLGLALARGDLVLLLNSDAFIASDALSAGVAALRAHPEVGLAGLRLMNPDGTLQAEYGRFASLWDDVRVSLGLDQLFPKELPPMIAGGPVDWVQGACMFVRAAAVAEVGGLDTDFFMYSEEVEWCHRFWEHGWQVWYLPVVAVEHVGGGSSRNNDLGRRVALYRSRLLLRRRRSGRVATAALFACIAVGLGARIVVRAAASTVLKRRLGRRPPRQDWELLRALFSGQGA